MTVTATDPEFEALLEQLRLSRAFDFTGYKRSTLRRRVDKRMKEVEVATYLEYMDYLEVHPAEFEPLFNTILINVTTFFRDPDAWAALRETIIPEIIARSEGEPIRVWSAGCASGRETYSLVIELAEALGWEAFRERVKVYATDVDEEALAEARAAAYAERDMEGMPQELRERYFELAPNGTSVFRGDLRRSVIFGRHDLVHDAPISHLDLLVCRNTLMYFNAEIQGRILARFHFALKPDSFLFLGKAEMMRSHASLFSPVDLKSRIFARLPRAPVRERLLLGGGGGMEAVGARGGYQLRLRDAALNAELAAQVVVDTRGALVLANTSARRLFSLADGDLGRPIQDLTLSYRPVELRSRIEQVTAERRPMQVGSVEHELADGQARAFDVHLVPLLDGPRGLLGVSVAFVDVTHFQRLQNDLRSAGQELETAYEELQSTNEELETTNEELQSTNEELETTNEELQSTNEELETMNEELQSTNEELETINDEMRRRTGELDEVNAYMSSILTSLRVGVVVLDRDLCVRVWNRRAEDLWGLRSEEVEGQALVTLDVGLPVEALLAPIRATLDGAPEFEAVLPCINRRGRNIQCRISLMPLVGPKKEVRGVVLLMEEWGTAVGDPPSRG